MHQPLGERESEPNSGLESCVENKWEEAELILLSSRHSTQVSWVQPGAALWGKARGDVRLDILHLVCMPWSCGNFCATHFK